MATATLQRGGSAKQQEADVHSIRTLSRSDLALLSEPRPAASLQTLRDTHHRTARAIAAGMRNDAVAQLCGISYNRVSILKQDPAFMELVAHYRGVITAEYAQTMDPVVEYLSSNALKAQRMLSDKLDEYEEKGEFLPTRDLLGIAELGLDRTGYGKVNKNLNVNVDFAAKLEAARNRSGEVANMRTITAIEVGPTSVPQSHPAPASSHATPPGASFRRL